MWKVLALAMGCGVWAQTLLAQGNSGFPPNGYRTAQNRLYWQNHRPYADYWQQDVHYTLSATLDADSHRVAGQLSLLYWNNSPDTLFEAFFHLYQNAFVAGSYHQAHQLAQRIPVRHSHWEALGLGTQVRNVRHDGVEVQPTVDNTILRVPLARPIAPGDSARFQMEFTTYFGEGSQRRRMKMFDVPERLPGGTLHTVKHYDVVHWYPRICVYDSRFRWHVDQHLGREFYGDFGTYDVTLTLPSHYVMDATGTLLNEQEVYPTELRQRLDLSQFANKPIGEPATQLLAPDGRTKTYRYHAENVHDFAWTADPTYRWGEATWNGIRCIALAQETNAAGWQDAARIAADCIRIYSTDFGAYEYPKMIVADARDGMEYPMLTLDGDLSPHYTDLLAHEIAHNWFFGMLGSNETYRAFLDEGFTQFAETWAMERLTQTDLPPASERLHRYPWGLLPYLRNARDHHDGQLNTHSEEMYHNYGMAYYKTVAMLYNLQYTLGDSLFLACLRHYVAKWKMAHPYPEDFRLAVTETARADLNWFFDQWLETDRNLDYAVARVRTRNGGQQVRITFKRKGQMVMPLDFTVYTRGADSLNFTLPVTYFAKNEAGRTVLPYWQGFGRLNRTHTVSLTLPAPYRGVMLDPSRRLADVYLPDNGHRMCGTRLAFSVMRPDRKHSPWFRYNLNARPALWWNGQAGLQVGAALEGSYAREVHRFSLALLGSTGLATTPPAFASQRAWADSIQRFNFDLSYSTLLRGLGQNIRLEAEARWLDGLQRYRIGTTKTWTDGGPTSLNYKRFGIHYLYLLRSTQASRGYLLFPDWWAVGQANASLNATWEQGYKTKRGWGLYRIEARAAAPGGEANYARMQFTHLSETQLANAKLKLRTRLTAAYADRTPPPKAKAT